MLEDRLRKLKQCVLHKQHVKHLHPDKINPQDCMKCDGFGQDAKKYEWKCYKPYAQMPQRRDYE